MCMWCILLKILSSQSSLKKFVRHRVQAPYLWTTYTIDLRNLSILNRLCEVGREETLLSCWILASHQPSLLLQHWMIKSPYSASICLAVSPAPQGPRTRWRRWSLPPRRPAHPCPRPGICRWPSPCTAHLGEGGPWRRLKHDSSKNAQRAKAGEVKQIDI